jgi:hypothetical protein
MIRSTWSLILGAILLAVGILQWVRPFSSAPVNPKLMILAAVLLFLRYGAVRQRQKRLELLNAVPKHPLGLSDTDENNPL